MSTFPPPSSAPPVLPRRDALHALLQRLGLPSLCGSKAVTALLEEALTHCSADAEVDYEKLEFYGDAVLRLLASEFLRLRYPDLAVGRLSSIRAQLVSDRELTQLGYAVDLLPLIRLGPQARGDATATASIVARSCEALIGALFQALRLNGSDAVQELLRWLEPHWLPIAQELQDNPQRYNWKTALQEWAQALHHCLPTYCTEDQETGHGHPHRFVSQVSVAGRHMGQGRGSSRRRAEQAAAAEALAATQPKLNAKATSTKG